MSERSKRRVSRIRRAVPLDVILENYGYSVRSGSDREQQFSCDLHGDRQDSRPSARYYPASFSWHCFACGKSRDAIATTMEKEGMGFQQALEVLEKRFGLPELSWDKVEPSVPDTGPDIKAATDRIRRLLQNVTDEHDLSIEDTLALWEAFDFAVCGHRRRSINEGALLKAFSHIHHRVMEMMCQS